MKRVLTLIAPLALAATVMAVGGACTSSESSNTELNPEGPPMIRQVLMDEDILMDNDPNTATEKRVFAFGTHPLADETEVRESTNAKVSGQDFRIIFDELLIGNSLEEVKCRGIVDDDNYDRVPNKATPDDIARCSASNDVLPRTCAPGKTAICICKNDAGCVRETDMVALGEPVGIEDLNEDGGADDTQFIGGAVGVKCDGDIDVPISLGGSYWNPSGDQNKPAEGGFERLGPAVVLAPNGPIPTNSNCQLAFASDVTDKQNIQVCAPPEGNVEQSCTPGDVGAFTFHSEAMFLTPITFTDGETGTPRDIGLQQLQANTNVSATSIQNIKITENGMPFTAFTVKLAMPTIVEIDFTGLLAANATYVITIPVTVTDAFGKALPQPLTYSFKTGP